MHEVESYTLLHGTEIVEKSPALYETQKILLSCSHERPTGPYPDPQESSQYRLILPSCFIKIQLNIILTSMPTSLPFIFPSKALYAFLFSLLQILVLFSMHFSPSLHYFLPLGLKYLPQHHIFKHPHPLFFP